MATSMDSWRIGMSAQQELKEVQAPLKEAYRAHPSSAHLTLSHTGTLNAGISCSLSVGKAMRNAGLHPMAGGNEGTDQLCSGDLLLESLVACTGVTLKAVATSLGIAIHHGTVTAEGDLDFRGTLGVDADVPVGFTAIRLKFALDCGGEEVVPKAKIEKLISLTERYCVVLQTLNKGVPCSSELKKYEH